MKKKAITAIVIAVVLIVLGAAIIALAVGMGAQPKELFREGAFTFDLNWRGGDFGNRDGTFGERPGDVSVGVAEKDNTYSAGGYIDSLRIDWVSGNVKIVNGEGEYITFSESASGGIAEDERLGYEIDGKTLVISWFKNDVNYGFDFRSSNKELVVYIPADLKELRVGTTSAGVDISGLTVERGLNVSTTSGDVAVSGADCGSVALNSTSGRLDFSGGCSEMSAGTVSGKISFIGSCGEFEADSTSGKVEAAFTSLPREISADTVSGAVELTLPANASFELEFDTISGGFDCHFPVKLHDGDYTVGSGGAEIDVDTVSGGLKIRSK